MPEPLQIQVMTCYVKANTKENLKYNLAQMFSKVS